MLGTEIRPKRVKMTKHEDGLILEPNQQTEPRCAHFVKRKKRFCKMTVSKGKQYCGEHEPQGVDGMKEGDSERMPCPLDPKHSCYKRMLQKHLKICNARRVDDPTYIARGINAGESHSNNIMDFSKLKLSELEDQEFHSIVEKVKYLHDKFIEGQIEKCEYLHESLNTELSNAEYGKDSRKHLIQASALLGILQHENQLSNDTSFLEFGAGKGQLAFYLAQLLQKQKNSQVILLDRMSLRHKKDNKIEDKSLVQRIRVDIADLKINALQLLHTSKRLVAISKHLCGAATDLTLRCITKGTEIDVKEEIAPPLPQTEFVLIALCCHHRCDWASFVGKKFFSEHNISEREFAILTKMVSWAICGSGMSRERRRALEGQTMSLKEHIGLMRNQRLSLKEREHIGFMCKRLLDYARLEYLRQHEYEASLKYYVDTDVTLENVCLLARKHK